jgi:hypothetical protein
MQRHVPGAGRNGHLEILIWARTNGCPWNHSTITRALRNGHDEVARWAYDNGCNYFIDSDSDYNY